MKINTKITEVSEFFPKGAFFHIVFEVEDEYNDWQEYSLQCCINEKHSDKDKFVKQINRRQNGYDDGICGDVNARAFKRFGKENCLNFLHKMARKSGFRII